MEEICSGLALDKPGKRVNVILCITSAWMSGVEGNSHVVQVL